MPLKTGLPREPSITLIACSARAGVWDRLLADLRPTRKPVTDVRCDDHPCTRATSAGSKRGCDVPALGAPRRSEQQHPPAGRRGQNTRRFPHHCRPGDRVRASHPTAGEPRDGSRHRRQRLMIRRDVAEVESLGAATVIPPRKN